MEILIFRKCVNSSSSDNCTPEETVQEELSAFFVQFLYLDHYVNSLNYSVPIKPLLNSDMIQLAYSSSRYDFYTFNLISFYTDSGWIMEDSTYLNSFQFAGKSSIMYASTPAYIQNIGISLTNMQDTYTREYIKLQTIFANTGGFIKFFMLFLSFINKFFGKKTISRSLLFYNFIINI